MTSRLAGLLGVVVAGCTNVASAPGPVPEPGEDPVVREHDERFVGLWAVTQPYHALYEQTHYTFAADGTLTTGASIPADCSGHLSEHCVTGSVANCVAPPGRGCTADLSCVFGDEWYSLGSATLVIVGDCSDGVARPITIELNPDASGNAEYGANATLVSVAGESAWSHDNWDWAFLKCPDGVPATCGWPE